MATVITIINYEKFTIVTYNPKTFIVQATGRAFKCYRGCMKAGQFKVRPSCLI